MQSLDRYISATLFRGWALAWLVLLAIFGLLAFVEELNHTSGQYQLPGVLRFTLMTLPQRALELAPAAALLGSLLGLATLSRHSEIVALRSAGMSNRRLVRSLLLPVGLLMLALLLSAEYIAAPLYQNAEIQRNVLRSGKGNLLAGGGLWLNRDRRFINVRRLHLGRIPVGVNFYQFNDTGELEIAIHAERATLNRARDWTLLNVEYKRVKQGELTSKHLDRMEMGPFWSRDELDTLSVSTQSMSLSGLYQYSDYLESVEQPAARIRQTFWERATLPLVSAAMVLLALPIGAASGGGRHHGFGSRLAIGALIGIVFTLGVQIFYSSGFLLNLDPVVVTLAPVTVILLLAGLLINRLR